MKNVFLKKSVSVVLGICLLVALSYLSGCQTKAGFVIENQMFYPNENGPKNKIHKSRCWSIGNYGQENK